MLHFCCNDHCQYRCDHTSVNCQSAFPDIQNLQKVILIHVPGKNHIIQPGSYDAKDHTDHPHIQIILRILPGTLCLRGDNHKTKKDCGSYDDPIICNFKSKDGNRLSDMFQMNSKMWKTNIIVHASCLQFYTLNRNTIISPS